MFINLTEEPELVDVEFGEKEDVLASLSEDTMMDNILDQIKLLGTSDTSYRNASLFQYFRDRIDYLRSRYPDDQEIIIQTNEVLDRIFQAIIAKFSLEVTFSESIPFPRKLAYVEAAYNFFILHIFEKTASFYETYIMENLDTLIAEGQARLTKDDAKNLSYKSILESVPTKDLAPLIYFIEDFLQAVDIVDSIQVIEYMIKSDEGQVDNHLIKDMLINETYTAVNFLQPLCKVITTLAQTSPAEGVDKTGIISKILYQP